MPYFPPSVDDLPATRFILFSDTNNKTRVIDESEVLRQGSFSFTGWWETPTLNRKSWENEYTVRKILILYEAVNDTTMTFYPTGDGGATYGEGKVVTLLATSGTRKRRAVTGFNTSGFDLRVRLDFDTDEVVTVHGYQATLVERSDILFS